MINFYTLYSSSSGNCILVSTDDANILIDAGVSASRLCRSIEEVGIPPDKIDAILITHEHSDHITGVDVMCRKYSIPIYANKETLTYVKKTMRNEELCEFNEITKDEPFVIKDAKIFPFSISHDAINPFGYSIISDGTKVSVVTDTGKITDRILKVICKSDAVLIESNHDEQMLKNGVYPYNLKKRILGEKGHLSNKTASYLAVQLAKWGTKRIALGHLSEKNNTPDLAYKTCMQMLKENGLENDTKLLVAPKSGMLKIL